VQGLKPLLVDFAEVNHWYVHGIPPVLLSCFSGAMRLDRIERIMYFLFSAVLMSDTSPRLH